MLEHIGRSKFRAKIVTNSVVCEPSFTKRNRVTLNSQLPSIGCAKRFHAVGRIRTYAPRGNLISSQTP